MAVPLEDGNSNRSASQLPPYIGPCPISACQNFLVPSNASSALKVSATIWGLRPNPISYVPGIHHPTHHGKAGRRKEGSALWKKSSALVQDRLPRIEEKQQPDPLCLSMSMATQVPNPASLIPASSTQPCPAGLQSKQPNLSIQVS